MNLKKVVFIGLGSVCVALGVIGIFLPLMPTTVFLLLAAYFYSNSSERFHTWLLNNRIFGDYIRNYKEGRGMLLRQKISTIGLLWLSISASMWFFQPQLWVSLLMIAVAIGVTIHIFLIKTCDQSTDIPASS